MHVLYDCRAVQFRVSHTIGYHQHTNIVYSVTKPLVCPGHIHCMRSESERQGRRGLIGAPVINIVVTLRQASGPQHKECTMHVERARAFPIWHCWCPVVADQLASHNLLAPPGGLPAND